MPTKSGDVQGTPNWVELMTNDQSAAKKFYESLLGWSQLMTQASTPSRC
jgi:predicted enzyme related to lactoylglutathione lyase